MIFKNTHTKPYNFLKVILLVMFIGHYSSITLFYHTHTVDGVTYCHSHLYWLGKTSVPVQLPQHSEEQQKLIQDYNHITWNSDAEIPLVEKPLLKLIEVILTPATISISLAGMLFSPLRAPPSFLV
jgi:hypothetical protein